MLVLIGLSLLAAVTARAMPGGGGAGPAESTVGGNTGAATYRIRIDVPPGPGGLAPDLALSYSSRQGDGPYGVGWSLGLGEIRCSARFGVPNYAYCNHYELNGELLVSGGNGTYHTFVESFQDIRYSQSTETWTVVDTDGTVRIYGATSDARIFAGSEVARWLLSEIRDPFGNSILFTYDDASHPGVRYPKRISYGPSASATGGERIITFDYETRLDVIHDFAGGIEREVTKRLTDIRVFSYGEQNENLVRRYAFGYDLNSSEAPQYATTRSRLSWVQVLGADCHGGSSTCTSLPRREFEYTNSHDDPGDPTEQQYGKFEIDPAYVIPFSGNAHLGKPPVRIGDINGDGLPDLLKGGTYTGGQLIASVELNVGPDDQSCPTYQTNGYCPAFREDEDWTDALLLLQVDRPRADFVQIEASSAAPPQIVQGFTGIFDATYSTQEGYVYDVPMANPDRPRAYASTNDLASQTNSNPQSTTYPGWIEAVGRFFLTDVNADGLADIVVSVHLGGVNEVLDSSGNPITPQRVPGRTVSRVFRNTGDPSTGWVEDADLAQGLPPFGLVLFESTYGIEAADPYDWDWAMDNFVNHSETNEASDACGARGLRGWIAGADLGEDVCIDQVNLDPRFADFNGDGFQDVMVLELDDPENFYRGPYTYRGPGQDPWPSNIGRSRAWIQRPNAQPGQPRWVRASEYDLPSIEFGATWGEMSEPAPFAHSGLGRTEGPRVPPPGSPPGEYQFFFNAACSGSIDNGTFRTCAPTSYNQNFGVQILDLNRDGLSDVIWALYSYDDWPNNPPPDFPALARGVLLNTGTGWCASDSTFADEVESECSHAEKYFPPESSYPSLPASPAGFAFDKPNGPAASPSGARTGVLADLNADGWNDYLQLQLDKNYPGGAAWIWDPGGSEGNEWRRDERYDMNIVFSLFGDTVLDGLEMTTIDINGDGAVDVVGDNIREKDFSNNWTDYPHAFVSRDGYSDLLRVVRNGRGGTIEIEYESAISQRDASLEADAESHADWFGESLDDAGIEEVVRWTNGPVVTETRVSGPNREPDPDGQGGAATEYSYAHPRYCVESRSDLGYRIVARTRPAGETVVSKYYQAHGRAGKLSRSTVIDASGVEVHKYEEWWETQVHSSGMPNSSSRPLVPWTMNGTVGSAGIHVGRLAGTRSMNLYGAGGPAGSVIRRTLFYDDSYGYGYNFVEKTVTTQQTGTLVSLRRPGGEPSIGIHGLVIEQKLFDYDESNIASNDFLKHSTTVYDRGRPTVIEHAVKARIDAGAGVLERQAMSYSPEGNLEQKTIEGVSRDQTTSYFYDGDSLPAGCEVGGTHASKSVLVCEFIHPDNHEDSTGENAAYYSYTPDMKTGRVVATASSFTDEPATRTVLDPLGRPVESWVNDGSAEIRISKQVYFDTPGEPAVVDSYRYTEPAQGDAQAIWSSIVGDGFGGAWKQISESPSGFVATATHIKPSARTVRTTLPTACVGGPSCSNVDGLSGPAARTVISDAIGRPVRIDTPVGSGTASSRYAYFSVDASYLPNPWSGSLGGYDVVLEMNGKGDLIQRGLDGDRIVWVEECGSTFVELDASTFEEASCSGDTPTTYYDYEATGELRTIFDARAQHESGLNYVDPSPYLQYHYDTLGRIVRIDDPALTGTGHSATTYDAFGNIETVTNARGQIRTHTYDSLNRLRRINAPPGEVDYTVNYRVGEKQAYQDRSDDYIRSRTFDGLGRLEEEQFDARDDGGLPFATFFTAYEYDLAGRVTEVLHPARHLEDGVWVDTRIRYEYDGPFLSKICDVADETSCAGAVHPIVTSMDFDTLGRRTEMVSPAGARKFEYHAGDHRLKLDDFDATGDYGYKRSYDVYDGVGNIREISGTETGSATPKLDVGHSYTYDGRNRIKTWSRADLPAGEDPHSFDYDYLGNLIIHDGEVQLYDDPARPHAITAGSYDSMAGLADTVYSYDADGNVLSILGGPSPRYFEYNSANQTTCISGSSSTCQKRIAYDVYGQRIIEYVPSADGVSVYIGDTFVYEHDSLVDMANVEVMLDGERIALKRFQPALRTASAELESLPLPPPWLVGGLAGGAGLVLVGWGLRRGAFVLVRERPWRAATALGSASALACLTPAVAWAGGAPPNAAPPDYYFELADPLGTGLVMLDDEGNRVRHQVFTPFGRIHREEGAGLRTYYAGHRRDEASGMFYMQARWFDPGSGRFLSVDPLIRTAAVPQSANAYSYAENNPVNGVDPNGTQCFGCQGPSGRFNGGSHSTESHAAHEEKQEKRKEMIEAKAEELGLTPTQVNKVVKALQSGTSVADLQAQVDPAPLLSSWEEGGRFAGPENQGADTTPSDVIDAVGNYMGALDVFVGAGEAAYDIAGRSKPGLSATGKVVAGATALTDVAQMTQGALDGNPGKMGAGAAGLGIYGLIRVLARSHPYTGIGLLILDGVLQYNNSSVEAAINRVVDGIRSSPAIRNDRPVRPK